MNLKWGANLLSTLNPDLDLVESSLTDDCLGDSAGSATPKNKCGGRGELPKPAASY